MTSYYDSKTDEELRELKDKIIKQREDVARSASHWLTEQAEAIQAYLDQRKENRRDQ